MRTQLFLPFKARVIVSFDFVQIRRCLYLSVPKCFLFYATQKDENLKIEISRSNVDWCDHRRELFFVHSDYKCLLAGGVSLLCSMQNWWADGSNSALREDERSVVQFHCRTNVCLFFFIIIDDWLNADLRVILSLLKYTKSSHLVKDQC